MAQFSYMGTKRQLAKVIAGQTSGLPAGPFLDLFSGISAAGMAVGTDRPIWCNDVQHFSSTLTKALYTSCSTYGPSPKVMALISKHFIVHKKKLLTKFVDLDVRELEALTGSIECQVAIHSEVMAKTRGRQAEIRKYGINCLFTTTHAGTYFGFLQSVEIDSIRFAIDLAFADQHIDTETHRWMVIALCQAVASASNSTGHFAQYLTPKTTNVGRVVAKRKRSVWGEWQRYSDTLAPLGPQLWRANNRVFQFEANELLENLASSPDKPAIVYADPPYTDDQYSRFYHILENVILYDYPAVSSKGEYRPNRFTSDFSLAGNVTSAFRRLVIGASRLGSALMISYPSNGLMKNSTENIINLLRESFAIVNDPLVIPHVHSTMGASKGRQKHSVNELIFLAHH